MIRAPGNVAVCTLERTLENGYMRTWCSGSTLLSHSKGRGFEPRRPLGKGELKHAGYPKPTFGTSVNGSTPPPGG
jgi:hypothetical protein